MRTRTVKAKAATILVCDAAAKMVEWLKAQDPDKLLSKARQVKDRFAQHRVTEVSTPCGDFLLKRYPRRLRGSKALRELKRGMVLSQRGIPCIPPVAVLRTDNYDLVITPYRRELTSGINLVLGGLWEELPLRRRILVVETVARLVGTLHGAGFTHGDLNASNILFENLYEGRMCCYLVDLGSARARRTLRARVKDLSQLWRATRRIVTLRQALRFLLLYCRITAQKPRHLLERLAKRVEWLDKHKPLLE